MNINLANIDFVPGQGGSGEAVIRSLDVTENGTYSAPSGVDGYSPVNVNVSGGSSLTPEEQEALDILVNSSDGVLNTFVVESEGILGLNQNPSFTISEWNRYLYDVDGEIYCKSDNNLFKYNPETLSFDFLFKLSQYGESPLWKDNSGRLYEGIYTQIDIENETVTSVELGGPYDYYGNSDNIYKGKYGIYILTDSSAYKFNEETQKFEVWSGTYTTDYQGQFNYCGNVKEYDGHIIIVENGSFYELIETEDSITITSVDPYFNTTLPSGNSFNSSGFYNVGNNYYYFYYNDKFRLVNNEWVKFTEDKFYYYFEQDIQLVSSNGLFILKNNDDPMDSFILFNPGTSDYKKTIWTKISDVAVDLKSDQKIKGNKDFEGQVSITQLFVENIYTSGKDMKLDSGSNKVNITGNSIVFTDYESNETVIKNGSKQIATVDQTFINSSTFIPYGVDGDNIGDIGVNGPYDYFNFNTYTNRLFINGDPSFNGDANWYEFKGKSTFDLVSFDVKFGPENVVNSPTMTISHYENNTYMWNDENTRWDLICTAPKNVRPNDVWFDGDNFRYKNSHKLVNTDGVWSWVSDPLNNIWKSYYRFGYKNGEVYAYHSDSNWHLYKYDKVNHTMNAIGFLNAGYKLFSYFNEMFFLMNDYYVNIIDLSKVDPNNPDLSILGKALFKVGENGRFIGATDRLWYYNDNVEMCSSYQYIYEKPEVPATDGTYTLKAVRAGDQITYNWVLDA